MNGLKFVAIIYGKLLTKITAAQSGVALSYPGMRGLYFLAVIFPRSIVT